MSIPFPVSSTARDKKRYACDGDDTLVVNFATDSVLAPESGNNHEVIGEVITTEKAASDE